MTIEEALKLSVGAQLVLDADLDLPDAPPRGTPLVLRGEPLPAAFNALGELAHLSPVYVGKRPERGPVVWVKEETDERVDHVLLLCEQSQSSRDWILSEEQVRLA